MRDTMSPIATHPPAASSVEFPTGNPQDLHSGVIRAKPSLSVTATPALVVTALSSNGIGLFLEATWRRQSPPHDFTPTSDQTHPRPWRLQPQGLRISATVQAAASSETERFPQETTHKTSLTRRGDVRTTVARLTFGSNLRLPRKKFSGHATQCAVQNAS